MDEYFCPKCGSILNNQAGFSPDCGAWTCTDCGKPLYHYDDSEPYYIKEDIESNENNKCEDVKEDANHINENIPASPSKKVDTSNIEKKEVNNSFIDKVKKFVTGIFNDNKIKVGINSADLIGNNIDEVVRILKEAGFTNIETETIKDLVTGWLVKDGSIEQVSINNQTLYKAGIVCEYDAEIVIKYHTFAKKR